VKLNNSGEEVIRAGADKVWAFVTDPARIGQSLPDVVEVNVQDPNHFDAVVRVAVGPVSGRFKLKFELYPDEAARRITLKVGGGGFGSSVDLTAGANVVPVDDSTTRLTWTGEAEVRGPVAAVGGRVLDAQSRKLIEQTFAQVRDTLSA
jgi:carbon monoxide dehydrogenase subunit G